jgi:intron-binding protein aquarius
LIIRRKPKENNFKAVLNSIKDVVHEKPKLPQFLSQILLGYGVQDESSSFRRMQADPASSHFNFFDTFVDE